MTEEQKTITAVIFIFHGWDIDIQSDDEISDEVNNEPSRNCTTGSQCDSAQNWESCLLVELNNLKSCCVVRALGY